MLASCYGDDCDDGGGEAGSTSNDGVGLTPWWRLCVMCMEDEVDSLAGVREKATAAGWGRNGVQVIRDVESVCLDSGRVGAGCETTYK